VTVEKWAHKTNTDSSCYHCHQHGQCCSCHCLYPGHSTRVFVNISLLWWSH